jgi:CelD/BcsL family acetyltransferase involved in cellulose biosynthesis
VSTKVKVLRTFEEVLSFKDSWIKFWSTCQNATPFNHPEWLLTWWNVYSHTFSSPEITFMIVEEDNTLCGILPLYQHFKQTLKSVSIFGSGENEEDTIYNEYADALVLKEYLNTVVATFAKSIKSLKFDVLHLGVHEKSSITYKISEQLLSNTFPYFVHSKLNRSWKLETFKVELKNGFESYLQSLSRNSRQYANKVIRASKQVGLNISEVTLSKEKHKAFLELTKLHTGRWQSKGETGAFASKLVLEFHKFIILNTSCNVNFFCITDKNGDVKGIIYCLTHKEKLFLYQSGLDLSPIESLKSPGMASYLLLFQETSEYFKEYDFMAGQTQLKKSLATSSSEIINIRIFFPTLRTLLFAFKKLSKNCSSVKID